MIAGNKQPRQWSTNTGNARLAGNRDHENVVFQTTDCFTAAVCSLALLGKLAARQKCEPTQSDTWGAIAKTARNESGEIIFHGRETSDDENF